MHYPTHYLYQLKNRLSMDHRVLLSCHLVAEARYCSPKDVKPPPTLAKF